MHYVRARLFVCVVPQHRSLRRAIASPPKRSKSYLIGGLAISGAAYKVLRTTDETSPI